MISSYLLKLTALALVATAAPVTKRSQYTGRATFFDVGLGNCGWTSYSSQHVVALNTAQYGSTSEVSQYCGQTVTITYQGTTKQATIVDSCPTCPYAGLDMSTSLFSALTGGDMGMGQMQVQWSFGSGSSSSSSSSSNSNKNQDSAKSSNSNNNNSPTTTTSSSSSASTSVPTNTATKLTTGTPQMFYDMATNNACPNVVLPTGIDPVSVAPSANAGADTLPDACGKWVQIWNPAMNISTKAMLTNYNLNGTAGEVYLGNAYFKLTNMTQGDGIPPVIESVTWGFLT